MPDNIFIIQYKTAFAKYLSQVNRQNTKQNVYLQKLLNINYQWRNYVQHF